MPAPIYTGDFDWKGKTYRGIHQPLVSRELWERVQQVLVQRNRGRVRKAKHNFAFARLIKCGHCGCSLVGECKLGRYVYYHCSGYKALSVFEKVGHELALLRTRTCPE
jgi:hypothetical protein